MFVQWGTSLPTLPDPVEHLPKRCQGRPQTWMRWAESTSRGNDEPRTKPIYETGKMQNRADRDTTQEKVNLKYSGTSTTNPCFAGSTTPQCGVSWPILQNVTNNPNAYRVALQKYQNLSNILYSFSLVLVLYQPPTGASLGYSNGALSAEIGSRKLEQTPERYSEWNSCCSMQSHEIFIKWSMGAGLYGDPCVWAPTRRRRIFQTVLGIQCKSARRSLGV